MPDDTIYVRVDPKDKEWLAALKKEQDLPQNLVIGQLIKFLRTLSPEEQRNLIKEGDFGAVTKAGSLMVRQAWLQHAFGGKHWSWALEESEELANEATRLRAPEAWKFAQYRAAYCWLEIAIELRSAAIRKLTDDHWNKLFAASDWSLCASIAHNQQYSSPPTPRRRPKAQMPVHPLIAFNIGCCWSLRAQYFIERILGPTAHSNKKLSDHLNASSKGAAERARDFNVRWREDVSAVSPQMKAEIEDQVLARAKTAMDMLELIRNDAQFPEPPRDRGFIVRHAKRDNDLDVVRDDEALNRRFAAWTGPDADDQYSLLETFQNSQARVPEDVKAIIQGLRPDGELLNLLSKKHETISKTNRL